MLGVVAQGNTAQEIAEKVRQDQESRGFSDNIATGVFVYSPPEAETAKPAAKPEPAVSAAKAKPEPGPVEKAEKAREELRQALLGRLEQANHLIFQYTSYIEQYLTRTGKPVNDDALDAFIFRGIGKQGRGLFGRLEANGATLTELKDIDRFHPDKKAIYEQALADFERLLSLIHTKVISKIKMPVKKAGPAAKARPAVESGTRRVSTIANFDLSDPKVRKGLAGREVDYNGVRCKILGVKEMMGTYYVEIHNPETKRKELVDDASM